MSKMRLKRRLLEAQKMWVKDSRNPDIAGMPGFMPGVLRGFAETIRIVRDFQREELCHTAAKRRGLTRGSAVQLYQACHQAYGRLRQSDRSGAIRTLKRVLDQHT